MKKLAYLFTLMSLMACSESDDEDRNFVDPNPDDIEIRVHNNTNLFIDDVVINAFSDEVEYGSVSARNESIYRSFPFAYSYLGVRFTAEGKVFEYTPTSQEVDSDEELEGDRYEISISNVDTLHRTFRFSLERIN